LCPACLQTLDQALGMQPSGFQFTFSIQNYPAMGGIIQTGNLSEPPKEREAS
jgi:hypothetical protein